MTPATIAGSPADPCQPVAGRSISGNVMSEGVSFSRNKLGRAGFGWRGRFFGGAA